MLLISLKLANVCALKMNKFRVIHYFKPPAQTAFLHLKLNLTMRLKLIVFLNFLLFYVSPTGL